MSIRVIRGLHLPELYSWRMQRQMNWKKKAAKYGRARRAAHVAKSWSAMRREAAAEGVRARCRRGRAEGGRGKAEWAAVRDGDGGQRVWWLMWRFRIAMAFAPAGDSGQISRKWQLVARFGAARRRRGAGGTVVALLGSRAVLAAPLVVCLISLPTLLTACRCLISAASAPTSSFARDLRHFVFVVGRGSVVVSGGKFGRTSGR